MATTTTSDWPCLMIDTATTTTLASLLFMIVILTNGLRTQEPKAQQNFIRDFERKQVAFSKSPAHISK